MKKKQEKLTEKVAWGEEPEANSCNLTVAFNWYNAIIDKKECKKYLIEYRTKEKNKDLDQMIQATIEADDGVSGQMFLEPRIVLPESF